MEGVGEEHLARSLKGPATVVTVLPDSGDKHISKICNPDWLKRNGFGAGETREREHSL